MVHRYFLRFASLCVENTSVIRDQSSGSLAHIFHESLAATTDMTILPGVPGYRPLRRTVQVRLGANTLRLPGGTPIFMVSRQQFMEYPGQGKGECGENQGIV